MKNPFKGTWHITEMGEWDEDYFNMEVQAFIKINSNHDGAFQFGLVSGQMDGGIVKAAGRGRLEFTWAGNDECDEAFGSGWLELKDTKTLHGKIKFHQGESSTLVAKMAKK